jgi:hypothetical protein
MHNVSMNGDRDEYRLRTVLDTNPNSDAEIVVETSTVDPEDYVEGLRLNYSVTSLHSTWGMRTLIRHITARGLATYRDILTGFAAFARRSPDSPYSRYVEAKASGTAVWNTGEDVGGVMHCTLHSDRAAFDQLLIDFAESEGWWGDPDARLALEIDILHRPYVYRNTRIAPKRCGFKYANVTLNGKQGYRVEFDPGLTQLDEIIARVGIPPSPSGAWELDHRRAKIPFMPASDIIRNYVSCHDWLHKTREILPIWMPKA